MNKISIVFLVRSLEAGGAERQLIELVRNLDSSVFSPTVITFYPGALLEAELKSAPAVQLLSACKRGRWDTVAFVYRTWRMLRVLRPRIVHGYMYGANELAWMLGRAAGARVVWGVRASDMELRSYDWLTRVLFKTGAILSHHADLIISNSEAGRRHHLGLGYPRSNFITIPNGIDTEFFHKDVAAGARLRHECGFDAENLVIGLAARIDPMKDHATFLRAAAIAARESPRLRFIIVGAGAPARYAALRDLARQLGIDERVAWLGPRQDMPTTYSAMDIATSSSAFGEGFSNTLAEAMACEMPCAATDVGDARIVVGDTGSIVPARDPAALAQAWLALASEPPVCRAERGRRARERIVKNFGVAVLAARTTEALRDLVSHAHGATSASS